jgi:methionyl-tRNA formyltransferase
MITDLQSFRPDYLLLAGIGILSPEVLQTAAVGVINAHPGLLPWLRGLGVVGRAVLQGLPVGATCHFVEPGIDTGPIIERRLLPPADCGSTLEEVERKADQLCARMLVDLCAERLACGLRPASQPQASHWPVCRWLPPAERAAADRMLQAGLPRARATEWQRFVVDSTTQRLATEIEWEPSPS